MPYGPINAEGKNLFGMNGGAILDSGGLDVTLEL